MTKKLATFNIEATVLEEFKKNTGGQKQSHVIENFMRSVNEEADKEKKADPPRKGAIINYIINSHKHFGMDQQTTLDLFRVQDFELVEQISQLEDLDTLNRLRRQADVIKAVSRTAIKKRLNK